VTARYALYYAPRREEALAAVASRWLGRSSTLQSERLSEITAEPRRYGFHATLKPPMALADGMSELDLLDAVGRFAYRQRPFATAPLVLSELSGFLALVLSAPSPELQQLADKCVVEFDAFRRPPCESELARRRAARLTQRQDELLQRWGYPYVLDQWRFHLTLTGRIADPAERATIAKLLHQRFAPFIGQPLEVRDLCVFRQPAADRPFILLARFRLGGGRRLDTEVWKGT
jgi:putative phosphonate metabolism protein